MPWTSLGASASGGTRRASICRRQRRSRAGERGSLSVTDLIPLVLNIVSLGAPATLTLPHGIRVNTLVRDGRGRLSVVGNTSEHMYVRSAAGKSTLLCISEASATPLGGEQKEVAEGGSR